MSLRLDSLYQIGTVSEELRTYLARVSPADSPELAALRERTAALDFVGVMQASPFVGHLLQFLIGLTGARRVLEVGVFTGCTTLAMASALPPDGTIVAVDVNDEWSAIGREYWMRSGCADRIDLRIGPATAVLDAMIHDGLAGSFDLAFIDADKDRYDEYFERCLVLLRDNGVMLFDNVLFAGWVPGASEDNIRRANQHIPKFLRETYVRYCEGLRRFNDRVAHDDRVDFAVLPMIDGITVARKKALHA